ncbi:CAAX prenyl protease 1 [Pelomyxa schiedti]|nr:CAAX prenyl protease 1 [Pelomyxa schiedti]
MNAGEGAGSSAASDVAFGWIVAATVGGCAFDAYVKARQHRAYGTLKMPEGVGRVFERVPGSTMTEEKFATSQRYLAEKSKLGFVSGFVSTAVTVILLVNGWVPWLWAQAGNILTTLRGPNNEILQSIVFAYMKFLIDFFIGLPLSLYDTFVIEEHYGFNRTVLKLFILDQLNLLLVVLLVGSPVVTVIILLVENGGPYFWFFVWLFLVAFSLVVFMFLLPNVILPLFNKLDPLEDSPLKTALSDLCNKLNFPSTQLLVMDTSKRSKHSNAMFLGVFKSRKVILYDTLKENFSVDEILGIVGHEIGHNVCGHTGKAFAIISAYTLTFLFLFSKCLNTDALYTAFGFTERTPILVGLYLFVLAYSPIHRCFVIFALWVCRKFETQADAFSTQLGFDLRTSLVKIVEENCFRVLWDPLYLACHSMHPPVVDRILTLEKMQLHRQQSKSSTSGH